LEELKPSSIKRKRTLISSFFITVLTGIALGNCVDPIWEIFIKNGFTIGINLILPYIFILTTIRFFVGNQIHLANIEEEPNLFNRIWLFDFLFIVLESFIIIFTSKSCSLEICINTKVDFFFFMILLLSTDVIWIFSQFLLGIIHKRWKRKKIPWQWALLNTITIILILLIKKNILYCRFEIILLGTIFTIAAIIDVILVDVYGLLKEEM